jgi:uncharacterized membrane protein YfcA
MENFGPDSGWLLAALFMVAVLYGAVGHGGASGYLAVMSLAAFAPATMRPTALVLNVAVSFMGTILFFRRGHFRGGLFWPFVIFSIPLAYVGGMLKITPGLFHLLLGGALALAALRLVLPDHCKELRSPSVWAVAVSGSVMGLLSGLIGVGGGIFLTPLLVLMRWADAKTAAAVSAPFISVNSLAGLAGLGVAGVAHIAPTWPVMIGVVLSGGFLGAAWGSGAARLRGLKVALSSVLAVAALKMFLGV